MNNKFSRRDRRLEVSNIYPIASMVVSDNLQGLIWTRPNRDMIAAFMIGFVGASPIPVSWRLAKVLSKYPRDEGSI